MHHLSHRSYAAKPEIIGIKLDPKYFTGRISIGDDGMSRFISRLTSIINKGIDP